ncbi:unnamed protein product [Sphagnum troendelagicum]|uniref:Uncharacterized protein n=1 Tax=Sphagnum troendelagicum TaxID=128251 RepID=A0ABP0UN65_9BRYO
MSRKSVQAMSVKELPLQDEAMVEYQGAVNTGQGEGPVDRTCEGQHNISDEMHPSVSIPSCWAEPTFEAACKLNQATVHCVTSGKTPGAGAAKPKCVEKMLICEFFEAVLQILAKYHKATMPVTQSLVKNPRKNPRFEAVAEWAKQSFHESLVPISMNDNRLFEKYHFQAWKKGNEKQCMVAAENQKMSGEKGPAIAPMTSKRHMLKVRLIKFIGANHNRARDGGRHRKENVRLLATQGPSQLHFNLAR